MRALVVYESLFGNTRQVAEAVAAGLAAGPVSVVVDCRPVDDPGAVAGADLVVAGGPTRALRLASRGTRGLELAYERRLQRILHRQSAGCRQAVGRRACARGCTPCLPATVSPSLPPSTPAWTPACTAELRG